MEQSQYNRGGSSEFGSSSFGGGAGGFGGNSGGFGSSSFGGGGGGFGASNEAAGSLEEAIPGIPGDDYPIFAEVPDTSFLCDGQADGGYYADPEAECQVFHICGSVGNGGLTKYSFLCPNGTLFQQQYFVCDWWFNVDCSTSEQFYSLNDENAAEREANSPTGAGGANEFQSRSRGNGGSSRRGGGVSSGRNGGASGSKTSASSPRGTFSSPDGFAGVPSYTSPTEFGFGPFDAGYGAPGGFGGLDSGTDGSGYSAPFPSSYSRRNARELPLNQHINFEREFEMEHLVYDLDF